MFYVHPYLGKIPILTNIFQRGWNHQLAWYFDSLIAVLFSLWRYETCHVFGCCNINPSFTIIYIYTVYHDHGSYGMASSFRVAPSYYHHPKTEIHRSTHFCQTLEVPTSWGIWYLWKLKQKFRKLDSLELIFEGRKLAFRRRKQRVLLCKEKRWTFCHDETFNHSNHSHTIHVWYIYLHLVVFNGKIYHTWMVRDWFSEPSCNCFVLSINYGHQLIWRLVVGDHTGWDKINFVHLNCRIQPLSKPFIWSLSGRFKDIFIYSIG